MGRVCITVNLLIDQNIILYLLPWAQIFAAQIFSELIFAIDCSKNRKFRRIIFHKFTIRSEIPGIYFCDWRSGRTIFKADGQGKIQANNKNKKIKANHETARIGVHDTLRLFWYAIIYCLTKPVTIVWVFS